MVTKKIILNTLRDHKEELENRFGVMKIGIFGSYARDSADLQSDIDILVEFNSPTFDNYMDLKFYLEDLLKTPVDLVLNDTLKKRLRPYITQEVVYA
jgi:predicted nucleotidyltransferase